MNLCRVYFRCLTLHVAWKKENVRTSETIVLWLSSNTHLPSQGTNWVTLEVDSQSRSSHLFWLLRQSTSNCSQRLKDPDCPERGTVTSFTSTSVQPHSSWRRSEPGLWHQWSGVFPKKTTPTSTKAKIITGKDPRVTILFWKGPKSPMCSISLFTFAISAGELTTQDAASERHICKELSGAHELTKVPLSVSITDHFF